MLVVDLHCENGHLFEGWFASGDELSSQQASGLLSCPVCGSHEVVRRPSASRLNVSAHKASAPEEVSPADLQPDAGQALQAMYLQAVRHVMASTEDVGERFVEEVRGIHHGDAPARAIRGQATSQEKQALQDEGIDVLSLPIPDSLKGTLQ